VDRRLRFPDPFRNGRRSAFLEGTASGSTPPRPRSPAPRRPPEATDELPTYDGVDPCRE